MLLKICSLIGNCDSKIGQHEASRVKWHSNFGQFFNGPSNFQPFQISILKEEVARLIADHGKLCTFVGI